MTWILRSTKTSATGDVLARLRQLFLYDPETGAFTRRQDHSNCKAGVEAKRGADAAARLRADCREQSGGREPWSPR